jgi:hypothetical protein
VKSETIIKRRLRKLRLRYLRQYLQGIRGKCYLNCKYNYEHIPSPIPQKPGIYTAGIDAKLVPRKQMTMVVMRDEQETIRLCTYGVEKPSSWSGDFCISDDTAKTCPHFDPKVTEESAIIKFNEAMADDEFVLNNMNDLAILQWVLDMRVALIPLTLWERFNIWLSGLFKKDSKIAMPPAEDLPGDIWDDTPEDS